MTLSDLGAAMASERVGDRTLVWRKGMTDWAVAGSIGELAQWARAGYDGADSLEDHPGKGAPS